MRGTLFRKLARRGFSVLEVFIAMSILAIAMVAIMGSQTQAVKLHDASRNISVATGLARQKMGDIVLQFKGKDFGELPEEKKGEFEDKDFSDYKWTMTFAQDEEYAKTAAALGNEGELLKMVGMDPKTIVEVLTKAIRRLTVTVTWNTSVDEGEVSVWTHYIDEKFQLPGGSANIPEQPKNESPEEQE